MASFTDSFSQNDDGSGVVAAINFGSSESASQAVDQLVQTTTAAPPSLSLSREIILRPHLNVISPDLSNPHYRSPSFQSSSIASSSFDDDEAHHHHDCAFLEDTNFSGCFMNKTDDCSTSDESDISAFLEYARDVVAFNNAPYDPKSFRNFELLLEECLKNHFLDDEDDQDSLMSIQLDKGIANNGYDSDATPQGKRALLGMPMISQQTAKRIKGIIATKKTIPSTKDVNAPPLSTINGSLVLQPRTSYTAMRPEGDSDDSIVVPSTTIPVKRVVDSQSRVAQERASRNTGHIII
ncbi:MAG: hypothetical protein SGARI_004898, partial [Bacillariaceae sp.]